MQFSDALTAQQWFSRACEAHCDGRGDEAIRAYRYVLKQDSEHVSAHYNLGLLLRRTGELDEAVRHFRAAVRLDAKHYKSLIMLGIILSDRGELAEARARVEIALRIAPDHRKCLSNLAIIYDRQGETAMALEMRTRHDRLIAETPRAQCTVHERCRDPRETTMHGCDTNESIIHMPGDAG